MKKILFVTESLDKGGAEKVLYDILRNIDLSKYKIDILLFENKGVYIEKIEKLGISVNYIFNERKDFINNIIYRKCKSMIIGIIKYFYSYCPFLIKNLKNKKYDTEIAFLEGHSGILVSNRKNNSKKISWIHTDLLKHRVINKKSELNAYLKMDKIICVSENSKISLLKLYPVLINKIEVIFNPIDKENILKNSQENINLEKNKINVITIGRLIKIKGYDILLQAHNKLIKEGLDYNLIILGEGVERNNLEEYIKKNNLGARTQLLGFKENPYPYLKKSDIFISSSRYEGYPLVLCEAICLEKPIIATNCNGSKEILENGKYGILTEIGNVEDLAKKMKEMILNKTLRQKYSNLSKERAEKLDMEKVIKEIINLF